MFQLPTAWRFCQCHTQPTLYVRTMLDQCWPMVVNDGQALIQCCVDVAWLLDISYSIYLYFKVLQDWPIVPWNINWLMLVRLDINHFLAMIMLLTHSADLFCRWAGALGQWLAPLPITPEFGVRFPDSAVWKKQKCFFPIHVWKSILWGASVTER